MNDVKLGWLLLGIVACGTGDGTGDDATDATDAAPTDTEDTDTEDTDTPTTAVSVLVEAAAGGTVEAFGATLEVPPGSLAADTEITVVTRAASGAPDAATLLGDLFDFGPDGLVFTVPATLTLPAPGNPAGGERFVVSWLDGSQWTDLPSTAAAGEVTGEVAHFSSFAARAVTAAVTSSACAPVAGCGGDPTGTWTATGTCRMSAGEVPFSCDVGFVTTYDAGAGSLVFAPDQTLVEQAGSGGMAVTAHVVPAECVPAGIGDCDSLYDSVVFEGNSEPTCTGDVEAACACTSEPYPGGTVGLSADTWSVDATTLTLVSPGELGSTIEREFEYCVDGDTLTIWDRDATQSFARR